VSEEGPILVTGAAGFIGRAVAERLLDRGDVVIGVDNFTDYYDPALKEARVRTLAGRGGFSLERLDVAEPEAFGDLVRRSGARRLVHLAAQAGVRHSIDHPFDYEHANLRGHLSVLEACRHAPDFRHLVYASSSSVYGERPLGERGFSEDDPVDAPVSLYAATKRAGELMSSTYAHLYGLPQSGLRFFTVYGPWGRPDMAYFIFAQKILAGEPIELFGGGEMSRDFTYIDDIVDGIVGVLDRPPARGQARILNIGGAAPRGLTTMIDLLERALGAKATRVLGACRPVTSPPPSPTSPA
jgi:UDP-glucuronate 4-epimerase